MINHQKATRPLWTKNDYPELDTSEILKGDMAGQNPLCLIVT